MSPDADAKLRARLAANTRWARENDRAAATRKARDGFWAKFEHEVDPDGRLAPDERARRAKSARKAHMQSIRRNRTR